MGDINLIADRPGRMRDSVDSFKLSVQIDFDLAISPNCSL